MSHRKKTRDRYKWEAEDWHIQSGSFAENLALTYPFELRELIQEAKRLRREGHPLLQDITILEQWINILESEAQQLLIRKGFESEYIGIVNIDEYKADDEQEEGPLIASAKDVVLQSHDLREEIEEENIEEAVLAAIQLTASAIRFETLNRIYEGMRSAKRRIRGGGLLPHDKILP